MSDVLEPRTSRRAFLASATGGAFVLAFHVPAAGQTVANAPQGAPAAKGCRLKIPEGVVGAQGIGYHHRH